MKQLTSITTSNDAGDWLRMIACEPADKFLDGVRLKTQWLLANNWQPFTHPNGTITWKREIN